MHLGVENVEAGAVEVAADAREQVGPVGRIHQHLQAFTQRGRTRAHHRQQRGNVVVQRARVPGDVAGVVAREVADLERFPQRLFSALRQ